MPKRKPGKKSKPKPPTNNATSTKFVVNGHDVEIIEGGLYERTFINGKLDNGDLAAGVTCSRESVDFYLNLVEDLAKYRLSDDYPKPPQGEINFQARQGVAVLFQLRWIREQIEAGADPTLLMNAIWLGEAFEKLRMLKHEPAAAVGKRSKARAEQMRKTRETNYSTSREIIREECRKRIEANPGLAKKPTTLRDILWNHFLRNGKQRRGFSKSAVFRHIRDLCDTGK